MHRRPQSVIPEMIPRLNRGRTQPARVCALNESFISCPAFAGMTHFISIHTLAPGKALWASGRKILEFPGKIAISRSRLLKFLTAAVGKFISGTKCQVRRLARGSRFYTE
jgi:hypothetical protein